MFNRASACVHVHVLRDLDTAFLSVTLWYSVYMNTPTFKLFQHLVVPSLFVPFGVIKKV